MNALRVWISLHDKINTEITNPANVSSIRLRSAIVLAQTDTKLPFEFIIETEL